MNRILFAVVAAGLVAGGEARAQLSCTPAHLRAGAEIRIGSPGAFGGSPSADVVLTYRNTAGGTAARFGAPRSWNTREVAFLLPSDVATGVYEVVLSSPAGALRNPSCFTVDPPLVVAPIAPRTVIVASVLRSLDEAVDGDLPCTGDTMITLWGKNFQPGTEGGVINPAANWVAGKTMVELGGGVPYPPPTRPLFSPPRIAIRNAGTIEYTISRCILLMPGLKARVWFPDGTKSAWKTVRTDWNRSGSDFGGVVTIVR
jgi:hypothetical protein